jgi:hypothetical protein
MDVHDARTLVGGWGLAVLGALGAVLVTVVSGPSLLSVLFALVALAGGLAVAGRRRYSSYLMPFVGALSLFVAAVAHAGGEPTVYVALFAALGVVTLLRGVRAYRAGR